jgi:hypothetical protein
MNPATITLSKLVNTLQQHYGDPAPPPSTDPLELIIWENIAYLASDERRAAAFAALKRDIGTRPEQILAAKHTALASWHRQSWHTSRRECGKTSRHCENRL